MAKKPSNIKERILHIAKIKGITQLKLCEIIDMKHGSFKGEARKTPLNSNAIAILFSVFPDMNLDWLFSGLGEPLKEKYPKMIIEDEKNSFLLEKIMDLTRENEQLRIENQTSLNLLQKAGLRPYPEQEAILNAAEPQGEYATRKPKRNKKKL